MDRIRLEFVMNVTEENLIAVMKGVVEGSAHWCCQMGGFKDIYRTNAGVYMANALQDGLPLPLHDDIRKQWFELDKQMVLNGIKKYLEDFPESNILRFEDGEIKFDNGRLDSDAADSILQYAAFGCIRYKKGVALNS